VTLKTLVTGVAAAAVIGGAAVGVTSIASPAVSQAQCADTGQLTAVLDGLAAPGVPFANKSYLVEDGVGIFEGKTADRLLKSAYADGSLPVQFNVLPPVCGPDGSATATVTAGSRSQDIRFVNEGGTWKLSRGSAMAVLSAFS
jgi:hypothetical protein